jgi:exodeoxyribonuclease V alpha subunit
VKNPSARLRNLPVTLASVAPQGASLSDRIQAAALESGVLDAVDAALMRSLSRRAGRTGDEALRAVLGCLLSVVRSGGLRIPLDPAPLSARLESFLKGLFPEPKAPSVPREPVAAQDPAVLQDPTVLAENLSLEFTRNRQAGAYAAILGDARPGQAAPFKPLLASHGGLYFQKHQAAEAAVSARLAALLSSPDHAQSPALGNPLDTVLDRFPLRLPAPAGADQGPAMEFDPGQKAALALALRKRFTVISGGPGTGKTSLAANLLRAWTRAFSARSQGASPRIRLAAPTGRAAQRLAESLRRSLDSVRYEGKPGNPAADGFTEEIRFDRSIAELPCETLHSLLRYNPGSGEYFHQRHRPLPADLVLVDEVSMVDIFALARLLEALEGGASLVLLGDMDQLPSVEAGSVLADLVPDGTAAQSAGAQSAGAQGADSHPLRDHLALLERSHRSQAGILEAARLINAMDGDGALSALGAPLSVDAPWPILFLEDGKKGMIGGGCRMLLPNGVSSAQDIRGIPAASFRRGWEDWLQAWVDVHYLEHAFDPGRFPGRTLATPRPASYEALVSSLSGSLLQEDPGFRAGLDALFPYLDQARILAFTRKGWHGSESINRRIRDRLVRRWDPRASEERGAFNGCPILILENDPAKGLFNGDVGVLLRLDGRPMAFFRRAESYLSFPAPFLPRHEPAFAMTVHKSQGSEYDQALIVLPESGNRLLLKETLYTALTRARHFAALYGPAEVFLEAVGRKVVRESGLPASLAALLRS